MAIKIKLEGFDEMLKDIEAAGGSINIASVSAAKQSAQIMQEQLKSEMQSAGVEGSLISKMPQFTVQDTGTKVEAEVGYKKGSYNPKNPSDGYKVVFLNYGTPHRRKHGKVIARGFIQKAKRKAKPKIKKEQQAALEKILQRLKR